MSLEAEALTDIDRRISSRIPVNIEAEYRSHFLKWVNIHIYELSHSGFRIVTSKKLDHQKLLHIKLVFPNTTKPSVVTGRVVWMKFIETEERYHYGIAIQSLGEVSTKEKITLFIAERLLVHLAKNPEPKGVECHVARNFEEIRQAYELVYKQYSKRHYCSVNQDELYYTYFSLLPHSKVIVLKQDNRVIGTLSLIVDSNFGLPVEQLFPTEAQSFRNTGAKMAEISLLALDLEKVNKKALSLTNLEKMSHLFCLFKTTFDCARFKMGVTDLVMNVHPKHRTLYEYLKFSAFGPVKTYPGYSKKPAVPMKMNIESSLKMVEGTPRSFYFSDYKVPEANLQSSYTLEKERISDLLNNSLCIWESLSPEVQSYFLKFCSKDSSNVTQSPCFV